MINPNVQTDLARRQEAARFAADRSTYNPVGRRLGDYGQPNARIANDMQQAGYGGQAQAMRMYGNAIAGRTPSAADMAGRAQTAANLRAAYAGIGASRAPGMAGSIYGAGMSAMGQSAAQAGAARQGEQNQAMAGYAGLAGQIAGQGLEQDRMRLGQTLWQDQNSLDWYRAIHGADAKQYAMDRDFWGKFINGAYGAVGGAASALGSIDYDAFRDERAK